MRDDVEPVVGIGSGEQRAETHAERRTGSEFGDGARYFAITVGRQLREMPDPQVVAITCGSGLALGSLRTQQVVDGRNVSQQAPGDGLQPHFCHGGVDAIVPKC